MASFKYSILENILKEGRLEDLITKYSSSLPEVWVRELSSKDPSGNNKYLEWMIKEAIRLNTSLDDIEANIEKVVEATLCFHENVNRINTKVVTEVLSSTPDFEKIKKAPKDINVYSVETIDLLCQYFEKNITKSASRVKIYEDDRYLVVSPLTHKASCQYGAHSNWCVSTSNPEYFKRYTKDGVLVFVIDNKATNIKKPNANSYKFAIDVDFKNSRDPYNWNFFDMEDSEVSPSLIISLLPSTIFEKIKKYVAEAKDIVTKMRTVKEDELQKNCVFFVKKEDENGNIKYVVFFDATNETQIDYFQNKYDLDNIKDRIKNGDFPFIVINQLKYNIPSAFLYGISSNYAKNRANADGNIEFSEVANRLRQYSDEYLPEDIVLDDRDFSTFLNLYVKLFNTLDITLEGDVVYVYDLEPGDEIIFRNKYRTWGSGEKLKVTRVAEKSLQLSNGKRIPRNTNSWNRIERLSTVRLKIVGGPLTNETRWVRKRII